MEKNVSADLLRNGARRRYYARWTSAGKQKSVNLKTDVFGFAKLRIADEAAKIEARYGIPHRMLCLAHRLQGRVIDGGRVFSAWVTL